VIGQRRHIVIAAVYRDEQMLNTPEKRQAINPAAGEVAASEETRSIKMHSGRI
jgi:hypothetical protein